MLALFPEILFLSPLSSTLLRIAAGVVFLLLAWTHYEKREELGRIDFLVVGRGTWIPVVASLIEFVIGLGLIGGIYTQAFAILGALGAMKAFIWKRHYSAFFPISRTASALLFVICLSLLVTGPGAFAFDLPL
ncbi:hypothetical protein A2763_02735 [Candidatus Kaiserbacteria bacterium RIFCSPHIGHO2_01_FULL_54_36]|uniref:DoxX family protein n=1 Tax=Candidatus Kaiserbacteria bacterium RIFCSPHIGHO2_01_FULL_54_36 TaxID=1798482 RepID=A0A1F6CP50_9BACT|nr:MAG: hypothetical protein A2763_02735 [Candidatus Kaiserbacteria bacterium RIFCSPHIGHO2_01_FULL_54_36]OGG75233.1 MAG: hypothetical protein A3A41_03875 [Candidatus Kaiserbacteria bacterium RIFCSPLOWO2_01_FULL_54_22]